MRNAVIIQTQVIASTNLAAIPLQQKFSVSAIATFTVNDAAGTLKIQVSNDAPVGQQPEYYTPSATSWVDLAGATVTVASGAVAIIPKTDVCYQYMRLVWTRSGGTGSFTVNTNVQGF